LNLRLATAPVSPVVRAVDAVAIGGLVTPDRSRPVLPRGSGRVPPAAVERRRPPAAPASFRIVHEAVADRPGAAAPQPTSESDRAQGEAKSLPKSRGPTARARRPHARFGSRPSQAAHLYVVARVGGRLRPVRRATGWRRERAHALVLAG